MAIPDWRVKIAAPALGYDGILTPLAKTGGVIFPYTPTVNVTYSAKYDPTALTHSNYNVHMYSSSSVENITIVGDFTAQDGAEAAYVLAVIHFFKSVTKMYYGQDGIKNGTPPPLCYLSGFGEYHFKDSPMAVTNLNLNFPIDVDYIPADASDTASEPGIVGKIITGAGKVIKGGILGLPDFASTSGGTTMVPAKIQIQISAIPIVSRQKVSNEFSLAKYKTGALLSKGFW